MENERERERKGDEDAINIWRCVHSFGFPLKSKGKKTKKKTTRGPQGFHSKKKEKERESSSGSHETTQIVVAVVVVVVVVGPRVTHEMRPRFFFCFLLISSTTKK